MQPTTSREALPPSSKPRRQPEPAGPCHGERTRAGEPLIPQSPSTQRREEPRGGAPPPPSATRALPSGLLRRRQRGSRGGAAAGS